MAVGGADARVARRTRRYLPLHDASVDRVVAIHALEMTANAPDMLEEVWRVLAARRTAAADRARTGAACGRAWIRRRSATAAPIRGRSSLALLREALFTPVGWDEALWVPPFGRKSLLRTAMAWERVGNTLIAAVRRRAHRGSDEAGLAAGDGAAGAAARTGARALGEPGSGWVI